MAKIKNPNGFIKGEADPDKFIEGEMSSPKQPPTPKLVGELEPDVTVLEIDKVEPVNKKSEEDSMGLESESDDGEVNDEDGQVQLMFGVSQEKLDEIKQNVLSEISRADNYYSEEIEPDILRRHKVFEGDKKYYEDKFPKLSKISDVTSSDFHDTVEWAIPSLIKVFFGGEDICKLRGVNSEEDERAAEIHSELIKYQLERNNEGFLIFYDWIKNALIDNLGIAKCYWEREEKVETKHLVVTDEQLLQMQTNPKINIQSVEEVTQGIIDVDFDEVTNVIKNQPKIEVVPPSEFRFSPEAKTLEGIDFVAHRKVVTLDYLRRRENEGVFKNIDKVLEDEGSDGDVQRTMYETDLNPRSYDRLDDGDIEDAKKKFLLYECYIKTDINDDDILEDVIVTLVGNTVIRLEENTMGRHPFFAISPIRDTMRLWPKRGIADLVGEIQDLKTAMLKQIIYNVAVNNDKQAFINIDALIDPNEFIDGKKAVRVNGDPSSAVKWSPIEPLQPQTFAFLENLEEMKENRTGITRYNQGVDANSLNKTATGITQIMNASNQRLELIARIFAETGVKQLFRHMIKMNQMFITEETFIRVTDQPKPIIPDDLAGTIDITVNIGVIAGTKQQQLQNMQLLFQMYPTIVKAGVADISHIAYAFGRVIESMGYKNTSDFMYTPEEIKMAEMQGVSPQMIEMIKVQQRTGQTPPALQQYQDNEVRNKMAEVAQTRGLTGSAAQSNQEQQLAQAMAQTSQGGQPPQQEDNTNLSQQQYAQRNAPQPNATNEARRTGRGG
jgi:hypothetical protein